MQVRASFRLPDLWSLNVHATAVPQGHSSTVWHLKDPVIRYSCLAVVAAIRRYSPQAAAPAKYVRTSDGLNMYGRKGGQREGANPPLWPSGIIDNTLASEMLLLEATLGQQSAPSKR